MHGFHETTALLAYIAITKNTVVLAQSSWEFAINSKYRQVSNIRRTLEGNQIVDHWDVVGASPVGAAPTTSSFST